MLLRWGQNRPGSNGNVGVPRIPQGPSITGISPSDCLVSYPGHSLEWGSYPSAEVQLVYSTAPANWANQFFGEFNTGYQKPENYGFKAERERERERETDYPH